MRILAALLLLALPTASLSADEPAPTPLVWTHKGFAALSDAATMAKETGKRLLLGLSGGST